MSSKLHPLRTLHLFAGAGGGILGDLLLGHRPICAVEIEPYCQQVLSARQKDGFLPWFPIYNDVATFDGRPWRGLVDVVSGGFPCQDISAAGKGAGITGERSGMWKYMARIIGEVRPSYVLVENSPVLTSRGLGVVLGDLAAMGYDAEWGVLGAVHAGGPCERERIWIVASSRENGRVCRVLSQVDGAEGARRNTAKRSEDWNLSEVGQAGAAIRSAWQDQPNPTPVADELAVWVDELACTGNGQVPTVVRLAWHTLHERLSKRVGNGA